MIDQSNDFTKLQLSKLVSLLGYFFLIGSIGKDLQLHHQKLLSVWVVTHAASSLYSQVVQVGESPSCNPDIEKKPLFFPTIITVYMTL